MKKLSFPKWFLKEFLSATLFVIFNPLIKIISITIHTIHHAQLLMQFIFILRSINFNAMWALMRINCRDFFITRSAL
ncbi:hypothetical protein DVA81_18720 [Acinetobacter baumannii]|nr:hypothetical protein DVA81_18720 [Acinetobacter baumannii]